jgi:hypothetical protein
MQEKLILNMPPGSRGAIEKEPYHTVEVNKAPATACQKANINTHLFDFPP